MYLLLDQKSQEEISDVERSKEAEIAESDHKGIPDLDGKSVEKEKQDESTPIDRSRGNNLEPISKLKDLSTKQLSANSDENSGNKEEKVGIKVDNKTTEKINEERDTKSIIDPGNDEDEPGSGENKEKKAADALSDFLKDKGLEDNAVDSIGATEDDKGSENGKWDNSETSKAKSDEEGIFASSSKKEEIGDEEGNEPGSEISQSQDDKENSLDHFTSDEYEDYINEIMKANDRVEEIPEEDESSLLDDTSSSA